MSIIEQQLKSIQAQDLNVKPLHTLLPWKEGLDGILEPHAQLTPATSAGSVEELATSIDDFGNPRRAALFETELAYTMLQHAPVQALAKVNKFIIDYLLRHKHQLQISNGGKKNISYDRSEVIIKQLLQYKFITAEELPLQNPVGKLIALLQRSLTDPQHISQCFTLHLLFFNSNEVYQPILDCEQTQQQKAVDANKKALHRQLRPKDRGEMFHPEVRGRKEVRYSERHRAAGITDKVGEGFLSPELQSFNGKDHTPYKYRAQAIASTPIVTAFRKAGVPFIAGPSGTTADCLESLHFLIPGMTVQEKQEYLNLMAAAEVMQGHNSIHEIMLTAATVDALPMVVKSGGKKVWDEIDYTQSYQRFLSDGFKETAAYKLLSEQYSEFLTDKKSVTVTTAKIPPTTVPEKTLQQRAVARIIKAQRQWRVYFAAKEMQTGTYWKDIDIPAAPGAVPGERHIKDNFIQRKSQSNMKWLYEDLGDLTAMEQRFLKLLPQFDFQMTHYTKHGEEIEKSGRILSTTLLKKVNPKISSNSSEDIGVLDNCNYVFFRFEIFHQRVQRSRFGKKHFIFNARKSGLFETGWISMFEMLDPFSASIAKYLKHNGKLVRWRRVAPTLAYQKGKMQFAYANGKTALFDVPGTMFHGPDILPGLALTMIRELRLIGDEIQQEFLADLSALPDTIAASPQKYKQFINRMNTLLCQLFRPEAKLPAAVYLANQDYEVHEEASLKKAITRNDISVVKDSLDPRDINKKIIGGFDYVYTPLTWAAKKCSVDVLNWLLKNGADPDIGDSSGKKYSELLSLGVIEAAKKGGLNTLQQIKTSFPDILERAADANGDNALLWAAYHGDHQMVIWLLDIGFDPQYTNTYQHKDPSKYKIDYLYNLGLYCIKCASNDNFEEIFKLKKIFPEIPLDISLGITSVKSFAKQYLFKYAERDDLESLIKLHEFLPDIFLDARKNNKSLIEIAAEAGKTEIVSWLLNQGGDTAELYLKYNNISDQQRSLIELSTTRNKKTIKPSSAEVVEDDDHKKKPPLSQSQVSIATTSSSFHYHSPAKLASSTSSLSDLGPSLSYD